MIVALATVKKATYHAAEFRNTAFVSTKPNQKGDRCWCLQLVMWNGGTLWFSEGQKQPTATYSLLWNEIFLQQVFCQNQIFFYEW